jgi:exodeoxyribonuclease VII large subunit
VVCTREELLDRIERARAKATQAARNRVTMLERSLRLHGMDRALGLLHRYIGRGFQQTDEYDYRLRERVRAALERRERPLRSLEARVRQFDVRPRLAADGRRLEGARQTVVEAVRTGLAMRRSRLDQLAGKLWELSPARVLGRGYAVVTNQGIVVTDAAAAPAGSRIHVQLHRGALDAVVSALE